ncbi:MAG TPA: carbohydrate ABC transporter permease [Anaerolineales bacterium]|nr:carbohydrate ABC transporter permease [Anaerolineales bacterium]HNC88498.1 carbohydrate ABC transporter permease [Anaerolineales bacterium]HNF34109.1 carbohydrate ABC transporter permease [Anaerolineales bacterium]HNO86117.1 carbohydrate ABC transporter permease [Anaerolineales bacterium]
MKTKSRHKWLEPHNYLSLQLWETLGSALFNLFIFFMLFVYLFPMLFMVATSLMEGIQLRDRNAPAYPSQQVRFEYQGEEYLVYNVPINGGVRQLALVEPKQTSSKFIDPQNPEDGLIPWKGSWRQLKGVYRFHVTFDNFKILFSSLRIPEMVKNTFMMTIISEIGVLLSSIVVAYGFSRFPLPGGNFLFYVLIATILIPEKVTLIPTYFFFARVLKWQGTWLPILIPFFFGNAVYIFLLRQNFKSIPKDLDEAAMLDGAGPLRILFQVILPQSWPTVLTVSLLHFYYMWNETRQAALYLSTRRDLAPISFGVQSFQSLAPIQNQLQAGALILMIVPVIVLIISQRYFMRDMVVTGMEK